MDSRNPKALALSIMHLVYMSNDQSLEVLLLSAEAQLKGYLIQETIFCNYDHLSLSEFKDVVNFLQATYREARKNKLSGFHGEFGACVGGKVYVCYLHVCLSKTGDKALMKCVYLELDPSIKWSSAQSFT